MRDWENLRYFLAVARKGTVSGAARELAVSNSTVLRRIEQFEKTLDSKLFKKLQRGYELTAAGENLFTQAQQIEGDVDKNKIAVFVESMPIGDSKFIRRFIFDNEPRLDLRKEVIAPSGERVMVDITFGVEFFRPFLSV